MNITHTPGPWTIAGGKGKHGDLYVWQNVKDVVSEHAIATIHEEMMEGAAGNARLIAAAPELLEALKILVARIDGTNVNTPIRDMSDTWNIARAAIAKATKG